MKKIPVHSALAYLVLAFIAMAGLSYINFLPGVVNALAGDIGFSGAQAGQVVALNGYGGLAGSTAAIFLVRRLQWQRAMFWCLAVLAAVDLATAWIGDYRVMLGWRFLGGLLGGLCMGIAFSALARLSNPDRAFGALLFVQFTIGALVIYLLPGLEARLGAYAVFYVMASFVLLSWVFLFFLPSLPADRTSTGRSMTLSAPRADILLLMLAIVCYQSAASAIWAYVGLIGLEASFGSDRVNTTIAMTGLLGLPGAMLPMISGNRLGRLYWLLAGVALSVLAAVLLSAPRLTPPLYASAMALLYLSWPAVQSYLLAVTAELDSSGQLSTIAAVISSVGLASGPLLASSLLGNGDFSVMLHSCAMIFILSFLLLYKPVKTREKQGTLHSLRTIRCED